MAYAYIVVAQGNGHGTALIQKQLNDLGRQGWRLHPAQWIPNYLVFEREIIVVEAPVVGVARS